MSALSLINLNKTFAQEQVLYDINLEVKEREFIVFVGPSGCGKSTLLRMISGLEPATSGEIWIEGNLVNNIPPAKRGIAMVFQSYALYPHLTVTDNMALALKQEGQSKKLIAERVSKAVDMLNLQEYVNRRPSELSGGQRQRVAIGRAIVREPRLFLFDEPLSNLDAALRMNTRIEIANLHRQLNTSMIYVTHDQTEAMTLADRIVILRDGRIEQIGTPIELYNNPVNQFVAGFLGSPPMNFIPASLLYKQSKLTMGIRPENFSIHSNGELKGKVVHYELLGSDTNIIVELDSNLRVTVRLFGQHQVALEETIGLKVPDDRIYLFDSKGARHTGSPVT